MISISFDTSALEQLIKKVNLATENAVAAAIGAVNELSEIGITQAKSQIAPQTGYLREGIHMLPTTRHGNVVAGGWVSTAEYAACVEFGTGATGRDTPVADKYPGGEISYKADKWKVNIPGIGVRWIAGMAARPYMYPSLLYVKSVAQETLEKHLREHGGVL